MSSVLLIFAADSLISMTVFITQPQERTGGRHCTALPMKKSLSPSRSCPRLLS